VSGRGRDYFLIPVFFTFLRGMSAARLGMAVVFRAGDRIIFEDILNTFAGIPRENTEPDINGPEKPYDVQPAGNPPEERTQLNT
jgi:hypothetical protein